MYKDELHRNLYYDWNETKQTLSQQASTAVFNIISLLMKLWNCLTLLVYLLYVTLLMFGVTNIRNVSNECNPTFVDVYAAW